MTPLRERMASDMTVRGLAENTKKSYLNSVSRLAHHYGRSPERISAKEVQDYLIFLHDQRGLTWQSCNCARHGIRFFYRITLGLPEPHFYLPGAKAISIRPVAGTAPEPASGGGGNRRSGSTTTGTKPPASRYCRRQLNTRLAFTSLRRATTETDTPG